MRTHFWGGRKMKKFKIFLMSAILLIGAEKINTAKASVNYKDTLISTQQAVADFVQYLRKQLSKYKISLAQDQIDSIIVKSRKLIYNHAHNGKISKIIERKIEKDVKIYLKNTYPDNFLKSQDPLNEVYYKQARNRIRAIVKDFIINKQQIKNPTQVNESWNEVKGTVYTKINKASYIYKSHDLVVDESAIPEISSKIFAKLEAKQNQKEGGNPIRKRKALFPEKITMIKAEKIVRSIIRKKGIDVKYCDSLTTNIMQKLAYKSDKRGRIERNIVITTTNEEVAAFKKLKENVIKSTNNGSYLDAFIQRFKKQFSDPESLKLEF